MVTMTTIQLFIEYDFFIYIIEGYLYTKYQLSSIYQLIDMTDSFQIRLSYTYCLLPSSAFLFDSNLNLILILF